MRLEADGAQLLLRSPCMRFWHGALGHTLIPMISINPLILEMKKLQRLNDSAQITHVDCDSPATNPRSPKSVARMPQLAPTDPVALRGPILPTLSNPKTSAKWNEAIRITSASFFLSHELV